MKSSLLLTFGVLLVTTITYGADHPTREQLIEAQRKAFVERQGKLIEEYQEKYNKAVETHNKFRNSGTYNLLLQAKKKLDGVRQRLQDGPDERLKSDHKKGILRGLPFLETKLKEGDFGDLRFTIIQNFDGENYLVQNSLSKELIYMKGFGRIPNLPLGNASNVWCSGKTTYTPGIGEPRTVPVVKAIIFEPVPDPGNN